MGIDLRWREGLHHHSRVQCQPFLCRSGVVLVGPAADDQGPQVLAMIGIDSSDAGGPRRYFHLVKTIKQREELFCLYPLLAQTSRDIVEEGELLSEPLLQWTTVRGPGGERQQHR